MMLLAAIATITEGLSWTLPCQSLNLINRPRQRVTVVGITVESVGGDNPKAKLERLIEDEDAAVEVMRQWMQEAPA